MYIRTDEAASWVWAALERADGVGLTIKELEDETDLTPPQIRKAIRLLNRILPASSGRPIACTLPGYRYVLTDQWPGEREAILGSLRDLHAKLAGVEPAVESAALRWGQRGDRRRLTRSAVSLRQGIADLLEAADASS